MTTINGYQLHGDLNTLDAGFSRWAFCSKNGHEYHIKEFLSPVYPQDTSELSERMVSRKRKLCEDFYARKREYYDILDRCRSGNNVLSHDFFRFGSKYYVVTDRIFTSERSVDDVCKLSKDKRMTLIKALLYSVFTFHEQHIVHGDLKPDNLLLKDTKDGYLTVKIIDFDGGFVEGNMPRELQGDFVYLSPEAFSYMNENPVEVTTKADVFALGLLIHQFWTGDLPAFDNKCTYAFQAALSNAEIVVSTILPEPLRTCVRQMLSKMPESRPTVGDVLAQLGVWPQGAGAGSGRSESRTNAYDTPGSVDKSAERDRLKDHRRGLHVATFD